VITRDETTRERTEEVTAYGNYHMEGQVMAPLQVERRARRQTIVFRRFFDSCSFDQKFASDFFYEDVAGKNITTKRSARKTAKKAAKQREKEERNN